MKILTIIGARPQFIKAAVVSRVLQKAHREVLVHTGQHYDHNMSQVFFDELELPTPDYNLGIAGGTHGKMTGEMLIRLEALVLQEKPDMVLLYGDTNSTLAGALAAVKCHVPICHVESGSRLGTLQNPEEVNRICADHLSTWLMCCTPSAMDFAAKEGLADRSYLVGDPMYDAFLYYGKKVEKAPPENRWKDLQGEPISLPPRFYYMTCHREENAGSDHALTEILQAMQQLDYPTIYPVHPRNRERASRIKGANNLHRILLCEPVSYLSSVYLTLHAEKILTDSGGLQREAYFAKKPCVTVFDHIVWPETMTGNWNQLAKADKNHILEKLDTKPIGDPMQQAPFGHGKAAEKILEIISKETTNEG